MLLWSHSSYSFFQTDMSLLVHCPVVPHLQCIKVNLLLRRSMYRKHDFAVLLCSIQEVSPEFTFTELVQYQEHLFCLFCCQLQLIYASMCIYKPHYFVSPLMENSALKQLSLHKNPVETSSTNNCDNFSKSTLSGGGGGKNEVYEFAEISPFIISTSISLTHSKTERLKFVEHTKLSDAEEKYKKIPCIISNIPLHCLVQKLFNETIRNIGTQHGMFFGTNKTKMQMQDSYKTHVGKCCADLVSVFVLDRKLSNSEKSRLKRARKLKKITHQNKRLTFLTMQRSLIK